MDGALAESYFYAVGSVLDAVSRDESDLEGILDEIVSLAAQLTGAKGSTVRVLDSETFSMELRASYGLSQAYLESGAIDFGKSVTELKSGSMLIATDLASDPRVQNLPAAEREGVKAVIGMPFMVSRKSYCVLRVYFAAKKTPAQHEMDLLRSLGQLCCLAIRGRARRT
jgi:GAF domain-containing protein